MTHVAGRRRRRIPRSWVVPLLGLVSILIAASGGVVSTAILIDLVAWWPVWIALAVLAYLARDTRWGRVRVAGLVPFAVVLALGVFTYGYAASWAAMPSASLELIGPEAGSAETAALSARVDGALKVDSASSGFLYLVRPSRRGGDLASPEAAERVQGTSFSVVLRPVSDPGLYTFAGWDLTLSRSVPWNLALEGRELDADLTDLRLSELNLIGNGSVVLGSLSAHATATIDGSFDLDFPSDAPVRVIGEATVPPTWSRDGDEWISPQQEEGWVVSVSPGSTVVVTVH